MEGALNITIFTIFDKGAAELRLILEVVRLQTVRSNPAVFLPFSSTADFSAVHNLRVCSFALFCFVPVLDAEGTKQQGNKIGASSKKDGSAD